MKFFFSLLLLNAFFVVVALGPARAADDQTTPLKKELVDKIKENNTRRIEQELTEKKKLEELKKNSDAGKDKKKKKKKKNKTAVKSAKVENTNNSGLEEDVASADDQTPPVVSPFPAWIEKFLNLSPELKKFFSEYQRVAYAGFYDIVRAWLRSQQVNEKNIPDDQLISTFVTYFTKYYWSQTFSSTSAQDQRKGSSLQNGPLRYDRFGNPVRYDDKRKPIYGEPGWNDKELTDNLRYDYDREHGLRPIYGRPISRHRFDESDDDDDDDDDDEDLDSDDETDDGNHFYIDDDDEDGEEEGLP